MTTVRAPVRRRRILFNWDVMFAYVNVPPPLTREKFVDYVFAPVSRPGCQVDAMMLSFDGGNVALRESSVLEFYGEADGFQFDDDNARRIYENVQSLLREGNDPPRVLADECRRRGLSVFASLRMNDIHGGLSGPAFPTFKRQHPEWLIQDCWTWCPWSHLWKAVLNFARPEVRELKRRIVGEFFDRYDLDGIELDWTRHNFYFREGKEYRNRRYLTNFMRRVRQDLDAKARHRGRPIEIAVRIPESITGCLESGLDLPVWIEEDLVDMLCLGDSGVVPTPGLLGEFRQHMHHRPVPIYPCVYPYAQAEPGASYEPFPHECLRAVAAVHWQAGAGGVETFNWTGTPAYQTDALCEIGDPMTLAGKDKHYTVAPRFERAFTRFYRIGRLAEIPIGLVRGDPAILISLPIGDDLAAEARRRRLQTCELWLGFDGAGENDLVQVSLNGQWVGEQPVRLAHLTKLGKTVIANGKVIDMLFDGVRLAVDPSQTRAGINGLCVALAHRDAKAVKPLTLTRVELVTGFARSDAEREYPGHFGKGSKLL